MPIRLVFAHLRAHWVRSLLTVGSLAVAVFLLCFLRTILVSMQAGVDASSATRLVVQSAVSLFVDLPLAYQAKIASVPGVEKVCKLQWFGGYYQDPSNFFAQFGVDHDRFFDVYPEVKLVSGTREDFESTRTGCVIGIELSRRYGWKVGDKIPIIPTFFPRSDGLPWEFEVKGVYESTAPNVDNLTLWFHFATLEAAADTGLIEGPIGVGVYAMTIGKGVDPIAVCAAVDALYENGPQRVQSTTEAEFQRQFLTMMGSVPFFLNSIGGAILFAILLAALNTMLMAARQRTHETGVLKALGFTDGTAAGLFLLESLLVCGLGGALGTGFMAWIAPRMASAMATMFPVFLLTRGTLAMGFGLACAVGLVAGIVPAWMASRLDPVEALRAEV